jgi:uncharacterized LabA/DUF88 family protein
VTTQNDVPENSDVNETVVQQPPASETPVTSTEAEVVTPAQEQVAQTFEEGIEEGAVRPFTDFIEEFSQTEVRFDSLLEEPQADPFASLIPAEEQDVSQSATGWANTPFRESTLLEGAPIAVESEETNASDHVITPVESDATLVEATPVEPASVETTPVEEQPRPPRRYRFDRRTPVASVPVQTRIDESKVSQVPSQALPGKDKVQVAEQNEQAESQPTPSTSEDQPTEQVTADQAGILEPLATQDAEAAKEAPSKAVRDNRRRHGQKRQAEKSEATPAIPTPAVPVDEVSTPVIEAGEPQAPEIALEDLPPLEYSELQAATSRRRRRRRSGSASSTATTKTAADQSTTVQIPPVPSPGSPVSVPRTIATPDTAVPSTGQYGVLSGYTVSQMNESTDATGLFMGPEPSPARGSTTPRTVRSLHNEAQRVRAYPARSNEVAPTSPSINQLANVIAQTIQAQTDRMVAELRRANQIPTSVSVSFPPFPSTERVGVFVDVANLLYTARNQRMTIDFGKLLDFLRGNRRLVRAHAYCPTSSQPGDDQMFLQAVKGLGYRITTKNYKTFSSGAKKADLDLDLCMDVVRLVEGKAVDCIVLVSGDSDFMPMLDYCSDHGVRVEVAAFDESMSASLRQSCDLFINLSMLEEIRA